jgi:hypothetical protein
MGSCAIKAGLRDKIITFVVIKCPVLAVFVGEADEPALVVVAEF